MATDDELQAAARRLRDLLAHVETCDEVGATLMELGQPLVKVVIATDYQLARSAVRQFCRWALRGFRAIRRSSQLSGDLIRARVKVEDMRKCCRQCLNESSKRQAAGEPFLCLVKEQESEESPSGYRFQLNAKGQIRERRQR